MDPAVWRAVERIPRGRVSTYGLIAVLAGLPGRARRVGEALRRLPPGSGTPWQRVVGAGGRISLPAPAGAVQRRLLEAEGVRFHGARVPLPAFLWPPLRKRR